jgi:sulfur carrier protein
LKIQLNGEEKDMDGITTLADLLRRLEMDPEVPGIAVARNGSVVPRRDFATTSVAEGDRVEIVRAVQGG